MKRLRDVELKTAAHELVLAVRDEKPPLGDLVLLTFFSATEALFNALKDRPLLLINLMQTNRAMYAFWNRVPRLWIALLDVLVTEFQTHDVAYEWADIYPFFVLQHRRQRARFLELHRSLDWAELGQIGKMEGDHLQYMINYEEAISLGEMLRHDLMGRTALGHYPAVVIAWDPIIPLYNNLRLYRTSLLRVLSDEFPHLDAVARRMPTLDERYRPVGDVCVVRRVHFGDEATQPPPPNVFGFGPPGDQKPPTPTYVIKVISDDVNSWIDLLSRFSHGPLLGSSVEITFVQNAEETQRRFHSLEVARALDLLKRLTSQLQYCLNRTQEAIDEALAQHADDEVIDVNAVLAPLFPLTVLDANNVRPYRDTLFRDVYDTPEKQHALLLKTVRAVADTPWVIDPTKDLRCVSCARTTTYVDTHQMLPFCEDELCRSLHVMCNTK